MKATIGEARRDFEQMIEPRVNDVAARRFRQILATAEKRAKEFAAGYVERREAEAMSLRDTALRELTDVRDALDHLAASSAEGRIEVVDYADQLSKLRARQKAAEEQLDRADAVVQDIGGVEEDPIAWFDRLSRRIPKLRSDFPW